MKIGYDAKRFFNNFTGLGNYSRFVIDAVSHYYPNNEYFLFSPKSRQHPEIDHIIERDNVHVIKPGKVGSTSFLKSIWRSAGISLNPACRSLNVYHGLSHELPYGLSDHIKKVVTIHDLIFIRYPEFYNPIDVAIYKAKVKSACKRADRIVAISEQTKSDIVDFLQISPDKIEVVYQGCHPIFRQTANEEHKTSVRARYRLPEKYLLNVGTIESRKNAKQIIEAMALLPKDQQLPLVIVGRATPYKDEVLATVHKHQLDHQVTFVHGAAFADLPAIYQMAEVFIYPSLFEGFGIPIVEAIESGVPVITSKGSCFSEAGGPSTLYVNVGDYAAQASAISTLITDHEFRRQVISGSRAFIAQFSTDKIAAEMFSVYKKL